MDKPKKRCRFCNAYYQPYPGRYDEQIACFKTACQKERKRQAALAWRIKHPDYDHDRRHKIRAWARNHPNYWQNYRKTHPDYRQKDNARRTSRRKSLSVSAKQDALRQISLERLKSIQEITPELSAKQDTWHRRVDGILGYLFWKELSAKQDALDLLRPSG